MTSGLIQGKFNLDIRSLFTGWLGLIDNFWFLKSCFICYALTWLCWRCGKYKEIAFAVVWLLCLLQGRYHLNLMFPCFLAGAYFRRDVKLECLMMRYGYVLLFLFSTLLMYKLIVRPIPVGDNLRLAVLTEDFSIIYYFLQQVYNILLGLSGAFCCLWAFKALLGDRKESPLLLWLSQKGGMTLGVYILQAIILEYLMSRYIKFTTFSTTMIELLMPILSVAVLFFCILVVNIINKSNNLAWLMFGKEKSYSPSTNK